MLYRHLRDTSKASTATNSSHQGTILCCYHTLTAEKILWEVSCPMGHFGISLGSCGRIGGRLVCQKGKASNNKSIQCCSWDSKIQIKYGTITMGISIQSHQIGFLGANRPIVLASLFPKAKEQICPCNICNCLEAEKMNSKQKQAALIEMTQQMLDIQHLASVL